MMRDFRLDCSEEKKSNLNFFGCHGLQLVSCNTIVVYDCTTPMMTLQTDIQPLKVEKHNNDDDDDKKSDIKS